MDRGYFVRARVGTLLIDPDQANDGSSYEECTVAHRQIWSDIEYILRRIPRRQWGAAAGIPKTGVQCSVPGGCVELAVSVYTPTLEQLRTS